LDIKYGDEMLNPSTFDEMPVPLLPGDLRLDIIKMKTYRLLYSARAIRKSGIELITAIRQLDEELEAWRISIPPSFRPSMALNAESQSIPDLLQPRIIEKIMICLEYHQLIATIHEAAGRCRSWSSQRTFEMDGVSSSLELAVNTSRSTFSYLSAVVHVLTGELFW
jgi:hypothetical protein